jgi:hypothetical protein
MTQPFLSAGHYHVFQVIGILLSFVFATLLFLVHWRRQRLQLATPSDALHKPEDSDTIQDGHYDLAEPAPSPTIGLPLFYTISFALICFGIAKLNFLVLFLGGSLYIATAWYAYEVAVDPDYKAEETADPQSNNAAMNSVALVATCALLAGSISLAVYARSMIPLASITYLGPMRIVGFSNTVNEIVDTFGSNDATCGVTSNIGLIQVAWGGSWGCPLHGGKECLAYVDSFFCDSIICHKCHQDCSQDDVDEAKATSEACLQARYKTTMALLDAAATYDPDVAPGQDGWQSHNLYGDCNTCKAEFDFVFNVDHMHVTIGPMSTVIYYVIGVAFALEWVGMWYKKRRAIQDGPLFMTSNENGVSV